MIGSTPRFNNSRAPRLRPIPKVASAPSLARLDRACAAWLDRLVDHYGVPRARLIRELGTVHALEYEIAHLLSDMAWRKAAGLLAERERPDAGDDLFSRAVAGCYQQLRDAEIRRSAARIRGVLT